VLALALAFPAGAHWDGMGVNFALFSERRAVELCLFDRSGRHEVQRLALREQTDQVWHGYLPQARPGLLYGYRVHGPYRPARGSPLQPEQAAAGPLCALHLVGACAGTTRCSATASATPTATCPSTAATARPTCRAARWSRPAFSWGDDRPPRVPWHEMVIYELHVRGLTQRIPGAAGAARHLRRPGQRAGDRAPASAWASPRSS
jgi:isoamylase